MKGVEEVLPGYIDGKVKNPSYREVCSGRTGHTEAISITYNPKVIYLTDLLLIFFNTHDPTTLNRQGNDVGTQYRSGIYFTEIEQKTVTLQIIKKLEFEKIGDEIEKVATIVNSQSGPVTQQLVKQTLEELRR